MVVFRVMDGGVSFFKEQSAPTKSPKHSQEPEKKIIQYYLNHLI